ncbi:MAG: hypothetical protein HW386_1349 [Gammaproteobacteria bacterium]|nr:hypothetical protein [Gammaproteobacteria bacterium]
MNIMMKISFLIVLACLSLAGCNKTAELRSESKVPEILQIHADGKMVFNDRIMPLEDVIIYPDGFGGEKAAVKLYTPYHRPFYRDSIIVERLESDN